MSIDDIRRSELWKCLNRNIAFSIRFQRIIKKAERTNSNLTFDINGQMLIVTSSSPIIDAADGTQSRSESIYEFIMDNTGALIVYRKKGEIQTHVGEEFYKSNIGVIKTKYTCSLHDRDGVVLSYQKYTDKEVLTGAKLNYCRKKLQEVIEKQYNPSLIFFIKDKNYQPKAGIIGDEAHFTGKYRSSEELAIVRVVECEFNKDTTPKNLTRLIYNSTLSSDEQINRNPEDIIVDDKLPIGTYTPDEKVSISADLLALGYDESNYQKMAWCKFLGELIDDRYATSTLPDKGTIDAMYDIMIDKLKKESLKQKGTNK